MANEYHHYISAQPVSARFSKEKKNNNDCWRDRETERQRKRVRENNRIPNLNGFDKTISTQK